MSIRWQFDTSGVQWEEVAELLNLVGMAYHPAAVHQLAFANSAVVIFVFDHDQLVGFGRAISDGAYQAAIYDVAVLPEYQGHGIGKKMVQEIVEKCPACNIILYAAPDKDKFYEKLNFRRMKTGMAHFTNPERMKERGFTE